MPEVINHTAPSPDPIPIPPQPLLEGEHSLGSIHSHSGSHNPQSPLQVPRTPSLSQEAQALCGDTRGASPSGADGTGGPANKWLVIDPGTTWEDYGPRLQVPKGYTLNEGANYIPFNIHLQSGKMKQAKYIKLKYGEDPLIYGMIDRDPHQYIESFQAPPSLLPGPCTPTPQVNSSFSRTTTTSTQRWTVRCITSTTRVRWPRLSATGSTRRS